MSGLKVAIYARVSTEETTSPSRQNQDPENQLFQLRDYCDNQGWFVVSEYIDRYTGASSKRPQFQAMLQAAAMHKFQAILVWKLDRFARSMVDFCTTVQDLDRKGVRFICTSQGIDTDKANPTSRLLMHLLAAFAEFEHDLISERIRLGIAKAKAKGTYKKTTKLVDKVKLQELDQQGLSVSQIAKALSITRSMAWRRIQQACPREKRKTTVYDTVHREGETKS